MQLSEKSYKKALKLVVILKMQNTENKDIVNILLADDHHLFRLSLKLLLKKQENYTIVGEVSDGAEVIQWIDSNDQPDIIIMDINMPEKNGIDTTFYLNEQKGFDSKILALSMNQDYFSISQMIKAGANGYVSKCSSEEELTEAIDKIVFENINFFSADIQTQMVDAFLSEQTVTNTPQKNQNDLSEREIQVLQLISEGLTNEEIGEKLFLSKRTVESHRRNMLSKTGMSNTAALVKFGMSNGFLKM